MNDLRKRLLRGGAFDLNSGFAVGEADAVAAAGLGFVESFVCCIEEVLSSIGGGRDCGGDSAGDGEGRLAKDDGGVLEGRQAGYFD